LPVLDHFFPESDSARDFRNCFSPEYLRMANPCAKYNKDDSAASPISRSWGDNDGSRTGNPGLCIPDEFHLPDYTRRHCMENFIHVGGIYVGHWPDFHVIVSYFGTIDRYVIATGKDTPACLDHGPSGGTSPN
jgi:hypothetical protein